MNNEQEITEICRHEEKIVAIKQYLVIAFFLASAAALWILAKTIWMAFDNTLSDDKALIRIIITLSVFASGMILGYLYDKILSKRLDNLWEKKKLLF